MTVLDLDINITEIDIYNNIISIVETRLPFFVKTRNLMIKGFIDNGCKKIKKIPYNYEEWEIVVGLKIDSGNYNIYFISPNHTWFTKESRKLRLFPIKLENNNFLTIKHLMNYECA